MGSQKSLTVLQLLPKLSIGGVERGTVQIAEALVSANHRSIVVSEEGPLNQELSRVGSEHVNWPIGRKSLGTIRYVNKLRELCLSEEIDIVHARSRLPAWIGRLALSQIDQPKRPFWITTVHGPYTVGPYSRVMVSGDRVIAISNFIQEYISSNYKGVNLERVVTIPRGVDEKTHYAGFSPDKDWKISWKKELGAKADLPLLTIPARLTRWKGQENFIDILRILKVRNVPFHGLIVGGTGKRKYKYRKELESAVKKADISEHISFLGSRLDLREIMSASSVVFSLTNIPEAFGRTTAEALSLGTPVVGYNHGGTQEVMSDWYPDGLVQYGSILEAADRTIKFLKNPPKVVGGNPFTCKKMQASTIGLYEQLAFKKPPTS